MLLEQDSALHRDFVQTNIRNFSYDEPDLTLISEDGREVKTNQRFLSLYTSIVREVCSDLGSHNEAKFSVPFPLESLRLLLEFLTTGCVGSGEERDLKLLMELMESLNICNDNIRISYPAIKSVKKSTQKAQKRSHLKSQKAAPVIEFEQKDGAIKFEPIYGGKWKDINERDLSATNLDSKEMLIVKEESSEDGKLYVCKVCEKEFKNKGFLKQHRVTHTKEKNFQCQKCDKKFATAAILYNHAGVHNPLQCELCDFKIAQRAGLQTHMKRKHSY